MQKLLLYKYSMTKYTQRKQILLFQPEEIIGQFYEYKMFNINTVRIAYNYYFCLVQLYSVSCKKIKQLKKFFELFTIINMNRRNHINFSLMINLYLLYNYFELRKAKNFNDTDLLSL